MAIPIPAKNNPAENGPALGPSNWGCGGYDDDA